MPGARAGRQGGSPSRPGTAQRYRPLIPFLFAGVNLSQICSGILRQIPARARGPALDNNALTWGYVGILSRSRAGRRGRLADL